MPNEHEHVPAELDKVGEILRLYTKALSGREIHLVPRGGSSARGAGWVMPSDGGKAVLLNLPAKIDRFPTEKENFGWYKIILTHQAGHVEFGTFEFQFMRAAKLFDDWRPRLAPQSAFEKTSSDYERLLQLFPDQQLGTVIFEQVEDARIDACILARYPGIRSIYQRVAEAVLSARPRLPALPLREAFLEGLVQLSLGGDPLNQSPEKLKSSLQASREILVRVKQEHASVEDSAEAALRIYQIAAQLPNIPVDEHDHEHDSRFLQGPDGDPRELAEPASDEDELPFHPPQEVEFRLENDQKQFRQFETNANSEDDNAEPPSDGADAEGPLVRDEPFSYLYPEWDFRSGSLRQRWCRVRERIMEEGTSDFYTETLAEHRPLVAQVIRRFAHFSPELFRKVTRRYGGEDIDLDGLIEHVVDRRAGSAPGEKIYWRRERTQRDVAVAVLLYMSATTNEYVELEAAKASRPGKCQRAGVQRLSEETGRRCRRARQTAPAPDHRNRKAGVNYSLSGVGKNRRHLCALRFFGKRPRRRRVSRRERFPGTAEPAHCETHRPPEPGARYANGRRHPARYS
jgi:nitric oxide reductase NorD protein